ncbi:MAG: DUF4291 domain-containing protein [Oscillospiraceae bacterium]|nr:DUF4291 domain-containing protein [Oscillospiraceae bacterium]
MQYKEIRAVYDNHTIRVYQAYHSKIAKEAVRLGTFGKNFKLTRMTWIKPSFLWMMYRCGWGLKENQEHVLAIDIKRQAFDEIVKNAVVSSYSAIKNNLSYQEWQEQVKNSDIRVQWDPERDIQGNALDYRSIQIGLRGQAVKDYVQDWIVNIQDITEFVIDLRNKKQNGLDISDLLPQEKIYFPET